MLSREELDRLSAKIAAAEQLTSAELRVVLTKSSWFGIKNKAHKLFRKYGLHKTAQRNAVMILVDTRSRELLIYGDDGVHQRVDETFWSDVRDAMLEELRAGRLADALAQRTPLPSSETVREELAKKTLGTPLEGWPNDALVALAAEASENAARSARLELYPKGMDHRRALALSSPPRDPQGAGSSSEVEAVCQAQAPSQLLKENGRTFRRPQQQDRVDLGNINALVEHVDRKEHIDVAPPQVPYILCPHVCICFPGHRT